MSAAASGAWRAHDAFQRIMATCFHAPGGYRASPRDRIVAAVGTAVVIAALGAALLAGLAATQAPEMHPAETLINLAAPPPPPRRYEPLRRAMKAARAPSPRDLRNEATPVVAPPPVLVVKPPPVIAANVAGMEFAANQGASSQAGPGTGAGGAGDGSGGGGTGGDGDETPPRQIKGDLRYGDLPADVRESGRPIYLEMRYRVETDGRATNCAVTRSSGIAEVDATICALIEKRYRFKPSLDADRKAVRSWVADTGRFWASTEQEDASGGALK